MSAFSLKERFNSDVLNALSGLQFRARYIVEGYLSGINKSPFHGYSSEFREYRDYQPGDDLRRLDWRLYARADRLYIRRYEQETNLQFYVVLDTSKSMIYGGKRAWCTKFDFSNLVSASLTWLMLKQKDSAGLLLMSPAPVSSKKTFLSINTSREPQLSFFKASQKPSQLGTIFRQLEGIVPLGEACLAPLLKNAHRLIRKRSVILLITDLLDPVEEIKDHLRQLRFLGHEILVFHVLDPDEQDFGMEESCIFEDLENGMRRKINSVKVQKIYQERAAKFFGDYQKFFQDHEINYSLMLTSSDPTHALSFFLAQRKLFI